MPLVRLLALTAFVALLLGATPGAGGPLKEFRTKEERLHGLEQLVEVVRLKGQEPAKIIASGADPIHLGLYVFDAQGNCVAWDDYGGPEVREDCAVVIVPPADGDYVVQVRSYFPALNGVRIVIR